MGSVVPSTILRQPELADTPIKMNPQFRQDRRHETMRQDQLKMVDIFPTTEFQWKRRMCYVVAKKYLQILQPM